MAQKKRNLSQLLTGMGDKKKKKPVDGGVVEATGGAGVDQTTLSSNTTNTNNLRKKYVDTFGQQPVETGHSNSYDEEDGKKVYYQSNRKIETALKLPHKGRKPKK